MKTASEINASTQTSDAGGGVLVTSEWLAEHLFDPTVRVVEVDVSRAGYDKWHIEGAVLWNVYQDLKDSEYRSIDTASLERLIARSGIGPDSTDFAIMAPGHDAWIVGDDPCVVVDWQGFADYARP